MTLDELKAALQQTLAYLGWYQRKQIDPTITEPAPPLPVIPPVEAIKQPSETLLPPKPSPAPLPPKSRLADLCLAMKSFEGWGGPGSTLNGTYYPNGTPSYRRNNPGNCRFSRVGYLPIYGTVINDNGFAKFKDYATGFLYMQNLIKEKIKAHPYWTLYDLIYNWAPPKDGNSPSRYTAAVAKRLGISDDYPVANLL